MITVIKQDHLGKEMWRYQATLVHLDQDKVQIEADFDIDFAWAHGLNFCKGDHFFEFYFFERYYNIFAIHDQENRRLKGFYCNIACPAVFGHDILAFKDLALDLIVFPDGRQLVVDQEEFNELDIDDTLRQTALEALHELQGYFQNPIKFYDYLKRVVSQG